MAPSQRRFKFRLILFGFFTFVIAIFALWFIVNNQDMFQPSTAKIGTAVGFIALGGFIILLYAIKVKLRQHNLIRW